MNKEEIKNKIKLIRGVHYVVFLLFFISLGLIFYSESLAVYGATAILFMGALQLNGKGDCPLTKEEHNARAKLGHTKHDKFVESVFKNNFNIRVSRFLVNSILGASFVVSGYVILAYIFETIRFI